MAKLIFSLATAFLAVGCSSFRPHADSEVEKQTGYRTMIGPIFAISKVREKAEQAAQKDCLVEGKKYQFMNAWGARKSHIQYKCIQTAKVTDAIETSTVVNQ